MQTLYKQQKILQNREPISPTDFSPTFTLKYVSNLAQQLDEKMKQHSEYQINKSIQENRKTLWHIGLYPDTGLYSISILNALIFYFHNETVIQKLLAQTENNTMTLRDFFSIMNNQ